MKLEEAKSYLRTVIKVNNDIVKEARKNGDINAIELTADLDTQKTVLQELDNSIPKDIIRQKINERQFELQQEYKEFKDDIKLNTLQEIYYLNDKEG